MKRTLLNLYIVVTYLKTFKLSIHTYIYTPYLPNIQKPLKNRKKKKNIIKIIIINKNQS